MTRAELEKELRRVRHQLESAHRTLWVIRTWCTMLRGCENCADVRLLCECELDNNLK